MYLDDSNNNQADETCNRDSGTKKTTLTNVQAMMLFRRIMDAGLLRNGMLDCYTEESVFYPSAKRGVS